VSAASRTDAVRAADAKRQRRRTPRRNAGLCVLRIEAHEIDLARALIISERLTQAEALRRSLIDRAAAKILAEFVARWKATPEWRERFGDD
jgi:hypothetical protein